MRNPLRGPMLARMRLGRETFQIGNVIVERVPVDMVDVIPGWDRAVGRFPDLLVQAPHASFAICRERGEIDAIRAMP